MTVRVAILGSTGSIGESALRVIERHPDRFRVVGLAAARSTERLAEQSRAHGRATLVVVDEDADRSPLRGHPRVAVGHEALLALAQDPEVDVVLNAVVGAAGLEPTLAALRAGKRLALANKESLVAGGDLVTEALRSGGGTLVPVDSEHSAILQCLAGGETSDVRRIVLTASGGPFRGWSPDRVRDATREQALQHPTWDMGAKITVDSATLANKALEVIEAHVLYRVPYDQIEVTVHPQSIIHSFVEFQDGSVLAQLGFPTMELPILYALSDGSRVPDPALATFDPVQCSPLTFEAVDHEAFPLLEVGVQAGRTGGTAPAAFNAANEVAVQGFLDGNYPLGVAVDAVRTVLQGFSAVDVRGLEDVVEADRSARTATLQALERMTGVSCHPSG